MECVKMQQLSKEAKEVIIQKALSRDDSSLESIAKANNVGYSTLSRWLKVYKEDLAANQPLETNQSSVKLTKAIKFNHVVATAQLDEPELGRYCRENGLYSHQLQTWREQFMSEKDIKKENNQAELKSLKLENKRLQKELQRKEKALAEASALLILKKKANLIWGEKEDD